MNMTAQQAVVPLYPVAPELEDEQIKTVARENRRLAFDMMVRKYRDRLFQHAFYMLKDAQEAFDVTQETFIRAYMEPGVFDDSFRIRSWLFRVLTNLCYNLTRDKRRRSTILSLFFPTPRKDAPQAIDELVQREEESGVLKALDQVPEKYRTILLLKYYDELSYLEIAEVLGCKLGTVMSRLSRAREKLQGVLDAQEAAQGRRLLV